MPRYIDANVLDLYDELFMKGKNDSGVWVRYKDVERLVRNAPTADVEEVKHGEWIVEDAGGGWKRAICSRCDKIFLYAKGQLQIHAMPRCPNCGAKMDGGAGRELKALRRMEGKRMNVKTFKLEDGRKYLVPARCCFNCKNLGLVLYDDGGPHTIMCELSENEKYADYAADMGLKCDAFEEKEEEKGEEE